MGTGGKVVSIFGGAHLDSRTSGADLINTPLQRGVVRARDGRKPFQRFPGLRYRNGPFNDPSCRYISHQESPHRKKSFGEELKLLVDRYEHRWPADGNR